MVIPLCLNELIISATDLQQKVDSKLNNRTIQTYRVVALVFCSTAISECCGLLYLIAEFCDKKPPSSLGYLRVENVIVFGFYIVSPTLDNMLEIIGTRQPFDKIQWLDPNIFHACVLFQIPFLIMKIIKNFKFKKLLIKNSIFP